MSKPKEGVSILDSMIADTVQATSGPADKRQLTSLPTEGGSHDPLPVTPAVFPHDRPSEAVGVAIAEIEKAIAELTKTRDALQLLAGDPVAVGAEAKRAAAVEQKLAEKEADRAAAKRAAVDSALADANGEGYSPEKFRALQKEAQDATFSKPDSANVAEAATPSAGVTTIGTVTESGCHPGAALIPDKSPKGREFNRCGECRTIIK